MKTKKWALWRKVDVKNLFSNTNALNQAGPTLQAMVLTGEPVWLNLWLVPFANVISFIYLATHGEISLLKLQQQKSVTFSVIKNSVLTFLSKQEKVSDTNFLSIANGSWYQSQLGKPMAVPVPFPLTIMILARSDSRAMSIILKTVQYLTAWLIPCCLLWNPMVQTCPLHTHKIK